MAYRTLDRNIAAAEAAATPFATGLVPAAQILALVAVALVTRLPSIGNPAFGGDEEFYLLVGDRIWQGALPFVDIWDRKPIGLFLLYALFRPLSDTGVVAYQLAAAGFAVATAAVLVRIASRIAGPLAALLAGVVYLLFLPRIGGGAGQSPVFYNLFTALAALLVVKAGEQEGRLMRCGLGAMLLVGMAIQVKYTAFVEGIGFGLVLLWRHWRTRRSLAGTLGYAVPLVAAALLPTALALAFYAAKGYGPAFVQANFLSIFQRQDPPGFQRVFLRSSLLELAPLLACALAAMVDRFRERPRPAATVLALVWSGFAVIDFFAIGNYFDHYALPLLMPLSIVLAPSFRRPAIAAAVVGVMAIAYAEVAPSLAEDTAQDGARIAALAETLTPYARRGCIYVYDGPPILYLLTRSCLPTPYVFPGHLLDANEARATGAEVAMAKLLDGRPSAIVVGDTPTIFTRNPETAALLARALAADYHLKTALPDVTGKRRELIYVRNDL